MMHEDNYNGLIKKESGSLVKRMDNRIDLVNRLIEEISDNPTSAPLQQLKCITLEIAQNFLDGKSVYLGAYETIDDAAATVLADHKGLLGLHGLTSLSDIAATALAAHQSMLFLFGLTSLSDFAVLALAQHKKVIHPFQ